MLTQVKVHYDLYFGTLSDHYGATETVKETPVALKPFHKSVLGARPSAARRSFNTLRFFKIFRQLQKPSTAVWSLISEALLRDHVFLDLFI